jgi:nucleotide-binding universal stress UspA family protein
MFADDQELVLVNVCPGIPGYVARRVSKEDIQGYYAEEHAKVIGPVKTLLAERGLTDYTIDLRHGHAAEEIIKSAQQAGAGLIVMGTRGHGIMGRALMGSVAARVVIESDVPVLLVK